MDWNQITEKARAENKFIFIDCYATWCAPCKLMDKEVYVDENVGDYFNDKFVSIKIQFDSSKRDADSIKKWYKIARAIKHEYSITAFPTFLFLAPNGLAVHKDLGYRNVEEFLELAKDAVNPQKQFYTLLEKYKANQLDPALMPYLATTAKQFGEVAVANRVANQYIREYLNKLTFQDLIKKENIEFIQRFTQSSSAVGFKFFYHYPSKIDSVVKSKGFSESLIKYIISKEEIDPRLRSHNKEVASNPDWNKIKKIIARKYNNYYAERTILEAQMRWYNYKKDWTKLVEYNILKIEKFGLDTIGIGKAMLNNMIYEVIFQHSNDTKALNKAVQWMEILLKTNPNRITWLDTYANLLYKLGKVEEAIEWEKKALLLSPGDKEIQETLEKIRNGIPTWFVPDEKKDQKQ